MSPVNSYLDRMFQAIVNQGNGLALLLDAVNRYTGLVVRGVCLNNDDVVDRFPVAVMQLERFLICRKTWRKAKFVDFQLQSQQ